MIDFLSLCLSSHPVFQFFFFSQVPGYSLCQSWRCQGRRWVGSQQQMPTWETMPSWSTPSWTENQGTPLTSPEPTKRLWSFWTRWEERPQDIWGNETLLKSPSEASIFNNLIRWWFVYIKRADMFFLKHILDILFASVWVNTSTFP